MPDGMDRSARYDTKSCPSFVLWLGKAGLVAVEETVMSPHGDARHRLPGSGRVTKERYRVSRRHRCPPAESPMNVMFPGWNWSAVVRYMYAARASRSGAGCADASSSVLR
jgi:hypothetical protein